MNLGPNNCNFNNNFDIQKSDCNFDIGLGPCYKLLFQNTLLERN